MRYVVPKTRWFFQGRLYEILYKETVNEGSVKKPDWKTKIFVQDYRGNTPYWRTLPILDYYDDLVEVETCEHEQRIYIPKRAVKEKRGRKTKDHA